MLAVSTLRRWRTAAAITTAICGRRWSRAALAAVEAGGPEAVSLRELAQSLGVSTAAPYRHFPDRRALLAEVAAQGFADLAAAYAAPRPPRPTPHAGVARDGAGLPGPGVRTARACSG